jgi:hypothetical protein
METASGTMYLRHGNSVWNYASPKWKQCLELCISDMDTECGTMHLRNGNSMELCISDMETVCGTMQTFVYMNIIEIT